MFFRFTVDSYRLAIFFRAFLLFAFLSLSPRTQAQFNLPPLPTLPTLASAPSAPVQLENRILFLVYGESRQAAQDRADLIQYRLEETLQDLPNRPAPQFIVSKQEESPVVMLNGQPLVTVTQADAKGYGKEPLEIARSWAQVAETAFKQSLEERRPGYLRRAALKAGGLLLAGALLHFLYWGLFRRFPDRPGWPLPTLLWLGIALSLLTLFAVTRPAYNLLTSGTPASLMILVVVVLAATGIVQLWSVMLNHLFPPLSSPLTGEERTERTRLRRITLIYVTRVTGITVIWFLALIVGLTWSGVNLPALLASAGLLGVAIGLASQDSMRDLVAGINVLMDDRYGVGDVIRVGNFSGKVERFNLRVTQIRDLSGRLVTFPNQSIDIVANLTASWSQVDFRVSVPYQSDLRRAMEIVEETARNLAEEWPDRILDQPQLLGVNSYNESTIELRLTLRTTPGDQWPVERELRLRVKEALERAEFGPPIPHSQISVISAAESGNGDGEKAARKSGNGATLFEGGKPSPS